MEFKEYLSLSQPELVKRIEQAKREKNALLLVHNYQPMEIQRLADFLGDSLELSRRAAQTDANLIVFCGVDFMAETAKILSPKKKVLLPDRQATCPMAAMVTAQALRAKKRQYPQALVVSYVAKLVLWEGFCYVHTKFSSPDVQRARKEHPGAKLLVHPECPWQIVEQADFVASTSGMVRLAQNSPAGASFIIGTEVGLVEQLKAAHPDKDFYPLREDAVCKQMKLNTLAKVAWAIENEQYPVEVPEEVRLKAVKALEKMLSIV
jgi:quinolinate synthase